MTYYKVPENLGGRRFGNGWYFVAGELWTENECKKHKIETGRLERVEVPRGRVYWMFGARFQADKN